MAGDAVVGQGDVGVDAVEAVAAQCDGLGLGTDGLECAGDDEFGLMVKAERGSGCEGEGDAGADDEAIEDEVRPVCREGCVFGVRPAAADDVHVLPDGLQEDKLADAIGVEKDGILDQQRAVGIISAGSHFDEHAQAVAFPKIDAAEGVALTTVHIEAETAAPSAGQRDGLDTEVFTVRVIDHELLRDGPDGGKKGVEREGVRRKIEPERRVGGIMVDPFASGCEVE